MWTPFKKLIDQGWTPTNNQSCLVYWNYGYRDEYLGYIYWFEGHLNTDEYTESRRKIARVQMASKPLNPTALEGVVLEIWQLHCGVDLADYLQALARLDQQFEESYLQTVLELVTAQGWHTLPQKRILLIKPMPWVETHVIDLTRK